MKSIKKIKTNIPKAIREQVWLKEFGKIYENNCYIHWCDNIINVFDFHVGHDNPKSKGGTLDINNLKPICARCNLSMSDNYTIKEWQKLTYKPGTDKPCTDKPGTDKPGTYIEKTIPHKLRRKKFLNCF